MPNIPTETLVSAGILVALIAGWRYVQQNPQTDIVGAVKNNMNLPGGKGLFEDELTGSASGSKKSGAKKSKKRKSTAAAGSGGLSSGGEKDAFSPSEAEQDEKKPGPSAPVVDEKKTKKDKKNKTLAEQKVKKAPKTEVDDMLPDDQKQPQLARVMKIVPEAPSQPAPIASSQEEQLETGISTSDDDDQDDEDEDDGWEMPKKFVGGSSANGSFASVAASSSKAPSAPSMNRFSLLTQNNPNFSTLSTRRTTSSQNTSAANNVSTTPTKIQRKNANKREAQKNQKEQEEKERLERLKAYRAEAAQAKNSAAGKKDALGKGVEVWTRDANPSQDGVVSMTNGPPLPVTIDSVVDFAGNTLFNPKFTAILPVTLKAGIEISKHVFEQEAATLSSDLLKYSASYAIAIGTVAFLKHLATSYNNRRNPLARRQPIQWEEHIVVVTGGASGIGALLARYLCDKGAKVVILDIQPSRESHRNAAQYLCDISNFQAVQAVASQIWHDVGRPTMLVNNAGVVSGKLLLDLEEKDVTRTFGVNVLSHFWTIKAFLPDMLAAKSGHIVTVASVLGMIGSAQMTDYCASKAALITMHDALRFELNNRYNAPAVRTTLMLPGHIRTPLFSKIRFPTSYFFRFMAPSLSPEQVALKILAALESQDSHVVRMPFYTQCGRVISLSASLVPGWLRDALQWITQADFSMIEYN